jgi:hypothetical protein
MIRGVHATVVSPLEPPSLGAGDLQFKSGRPDQNISRIFLGLSKFLFTRFFTVEFSQTGGLDFQVI